MQNRITLQALAFSIILLSVPAWAQRGPRRALQGPGNQGMCLALANSAPPQQALSAREAVELTYLREEEKLARDVYAKLQSKWGVPMFGNIAQGEERHFNAIKVLLDRYNLPDPAANAPAGVFKDSRLQTLHGDLNQQGDRSIRAAFRVGAAIEDLGIRDLEKAAEATDNSELKLIYGNLRQASENHLRAFVRQLQAAGETYAPQYIGQEAFADILANQMQTGARQGRGMGYGARGSSRRGYGARQ